MGYDVNTGSPLFARMYRGSCNDKSTIEDITDLLEFTGIELVVDQGFYSAKNLKLLSENDNTYIIPVPSNTDVFRNAMKDVKYSDSFYYRSGKKHARIEYMSQKISDTEQLDNNSISVHDILLMSRCMKMERRDNNWNLKNARKRDLEILKRLGFEPKIMVTDS